MLDYKLIEALAAVVMEGGFDKASGKLNITQSAISQRIKLLEDQAGQVLIVRSTPPVATLAGKRLIKHYMQVKQLEDELQGSLFQSPSGTGFQTLPIGINADSLSTWFFPATESFIKDNPVAVDLHVDDQEETHKMLRDGEVAGCISSRSQPVQGCSITYLGSMVYRLVATPEFISSYFSAGVSELTVKSAPAVIFNRKDNLHNAFFKQVFGKEVAGYPAHFVPSSEKFVECISSGYGYGMLPDLQAGEMMEEGGLVDLFPGNAVTVELFWHCWNLKSDLLEMFSRDLCLGCKGIIH